VRSHPSAPPIAIATTTNSRAPSAAAQQGAKHARALAGGATYNYSIQTKKRIDSILWVWYKHGPTSRTLLEEVLLQASGAERSKS